MSAVLRKACGNAVITHAVGVADIANTEILCVHLNVGMDNKTSVVNAVGIICCTVVSDQLAY